MARWHLCLAVATSLGYPPTLSLEGRTDFVRRADGSGRHLGLGRGVFVSDIFHEVDEEVRREQLKKLWERYQNLVIALIALILIGVAGWRGYEYWELKKASEAGAAFEAASLLASEGKNAEA